MGAGRAKKGQPIDHAVGIIIHHKVGDYVESGAELFTLHAKDQSTFDAAKTRLLAAHTWSDEPVPPLPHSYGLVK
jgi:thymidine phosphorylase